MKARLEDFFFKHKSQSFKKGETIIRGDETPRGIYYVTNGHVKMNSILESGREITFNIFKPGSFFPMIWAITDLANTYYFQALTDVELLCAPKDQMVDFIRNNSEVLYDLTRRILTGVRGLLTSMEFQLTGNSFHRVVAALLLAMRRFGKKEKGAGTVLSIPLTHQDIANIAGITRETASLAMIRLEKEKIISYKGRTLVINQPEKLEKEILMDTTEDSVPVSL